MCGANAETVQDLYSLNKENIVQWQHRHVGYDHTVLWVRKFEDDVVQLRLGSPNCCQTLSFMKVSLLKSSKYLHKCIAT